MKVKYGIELNELLEEDELIFLETMNLKVFYEDFMIVTESNMDAEKIQDFFISKDKFEEFHKLIYLQHPILTDLFEDYGLILEGNHFLLLDSVSCFTFEEGNKIEIEMALYQIEECLLATETIDHIPHYFVDSDQQELIERFAHAYEVEVSFFDLDKWTEND
ncbi:hypothetical protein [Bacillus sp. PS06]|uniref:hypothetical protein n=1 Tax=Bacillus sp. PS06 TaxID=2764176 RepID=UPI00177CFAF5|nr:hypothetical protein [Bacillus sp. PS06]MBD8071345.1 hypothetical protein [Bacillus sp. PS06]